MVILTFASSDKDNRRNHLDKVLLCRLYIVDKELEVKVTEMTVDDEKSYEKRAKICENLEVVAL